MTANASSSEFAGGFPGQISYRHDEGANILMFDGHAEHRPKNDVFRYNANGTTINNGVNNALWHAYR